MTAWSCRDTMRHKKGHSSISLGSERIFDEERIYPNLLMRLYLVSNNKNIFKRNQFFSAQESFF